MTRCMLIVSGVLLFLADGPAARAQVTLDVAKITCDQFTGNKITNPDNIAMWLSGYYNGKRGNTILDTQGPRRELKEAERLLHSKSSNPGDARSRDVAGRG